MTFEVLKGTKDSNPLEQIRINAILSTISKNFEKFGFRPFDTPLIEYFDTLAGKYDKDVEIVQEIFKVKDRGNRDLGLRYDLTVPLCRYVAQNIKSLKLPFRRYQIGKAFRDGPVKVGRGREFIQCDGDVIGVSGQQIEAELLELFYTTYLELEIDVVLELNNVKILQGALLQCGCEKTKLSNYILSIDKLKKIGEKGVLDEIKKKKLDDKKAKKALEILGSRSLKELEAKAQNEILLQGIKELEILSSLVDKKSFKFNFSLSRGLDIYTGNIWEVYDKSGKVSSSIGSGGRYDKVISDFANLDKKIPAVGISFGLMGVLACSKGDMKEGITDILVVPLDENLMPQAFKIAQELRKKKNVEICYDFKLKKAFSYAQYLGCRELIILGQKDVDVGVYTLKNIETGDEKKISFKF